MFIDDPNRFSSAADRFEKFVKKDGSGPPSRRSRYLARNLARTKANMLATAAVAAGVPDVSRESMAQISQERIIGSSDLFDMNYLELAIAVGRAIARIQIGNEFGTGFLVGPGVLMTNHHVLENQDDAMRAVAQFDYQDNASGELLPRQDYRFDVQSFFLSDEKLDFTLVGVQPRSNRNRLLAFYPWLKMIGELGKAEKGDSLNIIQHPRGGLKQIAFRRNEVIEVTDGLRDFLYYTTDTEPGSSGSPCFNDQWEIVALHHSGVPKRNDAKQILRTDDQPWRKGIDPEGLIAWIGNEGARISAIVAALKDASIQSEWHQLRDQMLQSTPPNPIELARGVFVDGTQPQRACDISIGSTDNDNKQGETMGQSFTWTIPVQMTVTVGGTVQRAEVSPPVDTERRLPVEDLGPEVTIDPDWSKRKGYDPKFLGIQIPVPKLSSEMLQNTVEVPPQFRKNDEKHLLAYYHYSVAMNKKRRCAWFSAGMIDGRNFQDFKRGKDKWFLDPRIDSKFQMGEELYATTNTDRGHLTRFKDLSWGGTKAEAVKATNDSFHFTNCSLQLDDFNQGKDRWQGLELFLLEEHAKKDERKMVVMTGPVLRSSDPVYKNKFMNYKTRIPTAFWKVCCLKRKDGSLSATAFTLGQEDVTDLPGFEEKLDVGTAQTTISELEKMTGLRFGDLSKHDHFAKGGDPGTLEIAGPEGKRRVKPIEDYNDIVV